LGDLRRRPDEGHEANVGGPLSRVNVGEDP
jgi:hypothetical protein